MSSDDSDDDFGPVIPPPRKKERPEADPAAALPTDEPLPHVREPSEGRNSVAQADEAEPAEDTVAVQEEGDVKASTALPWSFYERHADLPCAPLYERSFLHDRSPVGHRSEPVQQRSAAVAPVHDMGLLEDSLGAVVCSVDGNGVVRVWRMLPSGGLFFLGEQDRLFPHTHHDNGNSKGNGADESEHGRPSYYVCTNAMMQWVIVVCVVVQPSSASSHANTANVCVDIKRLNPLTLTVEAKGECTFAVYAEDDDAGATAVFTRRPFLLQHRYEPLLAFFVRIAPAAPTATTATPAVASGVVLLPCFPPATAATAADSGPAALAAQALRVFRPTRVSTANVVVACAQHTRAADRRSAAAASHASSSSAASYAGQSPALILVDSKGIIDYATIEAVSPDEEEDGNGLQHAHDAPRTTGLTLKVMGGLAMCAPNSASARVWQRWIRFDRRQKTGFFSLIRDVQRAAATNAGGRFCGSHVIPLSVGLSPTGRLAAVTCVKVDAHLLREERAANTFSVRTAQSVYVFDFPTGQCIGSCDCGEQLAKKEQCTGDGGRPGEVVLSLKRGQHPSTSSTQASEQFATYIHHVALTSFSSISIVESGAVRRQSDGAIRPGLYLLFPEVHLAAESTAEPTGETRGAEAAILVRGRPIWVCQVAFPAKQQQQQQQQQPVAQGTPEVPEVRCLPRRIGDLEDVLFASADSRPFPRGNHHSGTPSSAAARGAVALADTGSVRAPLVLLRRSVAPSQDLKNLLGRSPVGSALSPEELKKLIFTAVATRSAEQRRTAADAAAAAAEVGSQGWSLPFSTVDRLAVTTSLDAHRALIVYLSAASTSSPATAHLSATHRHAARMEQLMAAAPADALTDMAAAQPLFDPSWSELCREIRANRDFRCGRLLTLSAQSLAQVHDDASRDTEATGSAGPAGAAVGTEQPHGASRDGADKAAPSAVETATDGPPSPSLHADTATASAAATAPLTPAEQEDAAVAKLLGDVLPPPALGRGHDSLKPPTAFLTVRGHGIVQVHFLPSVAPLAVQNFIALARKGYYTGLTFHRVIPGMMVQGGCPRGDGTGGESGLPGANGAAFADEGLDVFPFLSHTAEHQWLCMANAGRDTNGSQFFLTVPGAGNGGPRRGKGAEHEQGLFWLNGKHTVFGYVVGGAAVIRAMSEVPRDEQDKPLRPLVMDRVDIL